MASPPTEPARDSSAASQAPPPEGSGESKRRGRGRGPGYRPLNLLAGRPFAKRTQIAARLVERVAADLPREEKLRRVGAMVRRVPKGMQPQEAGATVAIAVLEEEQRSAQARIRRQERELADMGRRLVRVSLALRRRPLACSAGRHRRAPSARPTRRRGSRRGLGSRGDPDGGGDEPPDDEPLAPPRAASTDQSDAARMHRSQRTDAAAAPRPEPGGRAAT